MSTKLDPLSAGRTSQLRPLDLIPSETSPHTTAALRALSNASYSNESVPLTATDLTSTSPNLLASTSLSTVNEGVSDQPAEPPVQPSQEVEARYNQPQTEEEIIAEAMVFAAQKIAIAKDINAFNSEIKELGQTPIDEEGFKKRAAKVGVSEDFGYLFWYQLEISFAKFWHAVKAHPENPYEHPNVLAACDEVMQVSYAVTRLLLEHLNDSSQQVTFTWFRVEQLRGCHVAYMWIKCQALESNQIDSDGVSAEYKKQFYTPGTMQNRWNILYNHSCRLGSFISTDTIKRIKCSDPQFKNPFIADELVNVKHPWFNGYEQPEEADRKTSSGCLLV